MRSEWSESLGLTWIAVSLQIASCSNVQITTGSRLEVGTTSRRFGSGTPHVGRDTVVE